MGRMSIYAGDDYALKLSKLAADSEELAKKAIYVGIEVVANEIKGNLAEVLSGDSTGEMEKSFGITPITKDKDGNWNAHAGFEGYSGKSTEDYPKGTPNQLKARVLESGSSKQKKRPFVRPAIRSSRAKVLMKMNEVLEREMKKR